MIFKIDLTNCLFLVFIIQLWYSSYYKNNILNNVECKGSNAELQKEAIGNCLKVYLSF
jgi:hypothetical protein